MPKISIIIPTYNNEKYIRECLDSVITQTYKDIEIIIINDGSTDATREIIDQYVKNDTRVSAYHIENQGYGNAVNVGLRYSKGEYIGIVESDDYIQKDMYEKLITAIEKYNCDWVKADFNRFIGEGEERVFEPQNIAPENLYNQVLDPHETREVFDAKIYTWAGLYKKSFLLENDIKHNESRGASYQDNGFWFQIITSASKIMFINETLYNFRTDNRKSSMLSDSKVFCICDEYKFIYKQVFGKNDSNNQFIYEFWYRRFKSYNVHLDRINEKHKLSFLERFSKDFKDARRKKELSRDYFSANDWENLQLIMSDYRSMYINKYADVEALIEYMKETESVNVYIGDEIGKRIFGQIISCRKDIVVKRVIIPTYKVLHAHDKPSEFHGYPVTLLSSVKNAEKHDTLLVCTANSLWEQTINELQERKFSRIVPVSQNYLVENSIKISVILPIYNAEKYITKCIDSIIKQSYSNIELILVDDGSTDKCPQICDEYAKKDNRIKVLHQENQGVAAARKHGLQMATGEFYTYVDSEECLDVDYYKEIYWKIIENGYIRSKERCLSKIFDMPQISIIIPTYNNEVYLRECIDSVLAQTYSDIEILVVNDGSTDATKEIVDSYVKAKKNVRAFHIPNGGYGHAVNVGLKHSKGKYIGIVESDDYIEKDMYQKLIDSMERYYCDWVKADFCRFIGEGEEREFELQNIAPENLYHQVLDPHETREVFDAKIYTWAGLYKKSFLLENNIKHNESPGASYQDNGFWFQTITAANRIMFINESLYNLRRDNSNSSMLSDAKVFCVCDEYSFIYKKMFGQDESKIQFMNEFWFRRFKSYNVHLDRVNEKYKLSFLERFSSDFRDARRKNELAKEYFSANDWENLQLIMSDYRSMYINKYADVESFIEYMKEAESVNVYIGDEIGRRIFGQLINGRKDIAVKQLVIPSYKVLDEDRKLLEFHGYPVTLLASVKNTEKSDVMLLCTANGAWEQTINDLLERKFSRIIPISQNYLEAETIKISVIVPIYNAEKYIEQCIDSIINQSYANMEIILVNDGSTDKCSQICDEYAQRDSRIRVLHQKNRGLVNARKSGLQMATGEYVTYVDADDWLDTDYYEKIYWKIVENRADIVATGCIKEFTDSSQVLKNSIRTGFYEKAHLEKDVLSRMLYYGKWYKFGILQYVWNKFYKRELLLKNQMMVGEQIKNGEDVACVYPCVLDADTIEVLNMAKYHYRMHEESMSNQCDDSFVDNAHLVYEHLKEIFKKSVYSEILMWQLTRYMLYLLQVGTQSAYGLQTKASNPLDFGKIKYQSKNILISGGDRGSEYFKQMQTSPICEVLEWINIDLDEEERTLTNDEICRIKEKEFDTIIIGTKNIEVYENIYNTLVEQGVAGSSIIRVQ